MRCLAVGDCYDVDDGDGHDEEDDDGDDAADDGEDDDDDVVHVVGDDVVDDDDDVWDGDERAQGQQTVVLPEFFLAPLIRGAPRISRRAVMWSG